MQVVVSPAVWERLGLTQITPDLLLLARRASATSGPGRIAAEQLAAAFTHADIVHFFDLTLPFLAPHRAFTATVHDAAIAHRFARERTTHKRIIQPQAARRAQMLIAVSQFAKDEAVAHFGADPTRVEVVHSGPGLNSELSLARSRPVQPVGNGARSPYLLYVGNLLAHKNLPFLIEAFGQLNPAADLLLVGAWGTERQHLEALIAASPAGDRISILTDADDATLDGLYRDAAALLLPSLYEGFGFTALEAMARGCAVLASDIPALREVCRDGALHLPVSDQAAWSQAMFKALADPTSLGALRARGANVVSSYTWERTGRGVCDVFRRMRAGTSGS